MAVFNIYKPAGLTPLQALEKLRAGKPELATEKMTYAGRLDPLAEGVLLIVSGEDIARKEDFLSLPKTYEVEVLLGLSTDTGDILGLVEDITLAQVESEVVAGAAGKLVGKHQQTAPRYSSPGIDGKTFAKEIEIFSVEIGEKRNISAPDLLVDIRKRVGEVSGNFRQAEITEAWQKALSGTDQVFPILTFTVSASSGTYMRVLAEDLGKSLGFPAVAYSIKRTQVGEYRISDPFPL